MSKYRVRKVYEERYNNYVSNYHINQVKELEEGGAPANLAPEPVSKDRLKNKSKQRQDPIAEILPIVDGSAAALPALRPTWKVNAKYTPSSGQRLRLCMYDKAYERDSM